MRSYLLKILSILCFIIISSCNQLFHDEDDTYIKIDTKQEMIDLLNGIYNNLIHVHNDDYIRILSRGDDVNSYYNYSFMTETGGCQIGGTGLPPISEVTNSIYNYLYNAIINTNTLLNQASINDHQLVKGEVYFLRAYCYFKLARIFGKPPIITDIEVNYNIGKPSYEQVYKFIESDLLKAIELLPNTYTDARIPSESPHEGTAKALLAEVYLTMAGFPLNDTDKYNDAAYLAGDVIANADAYNFKLIDDYGDLWKEENAQNTENVFGLFFGPSQDNVINEYGSSQIFTFNEGSRFDIRTNRLHISSNFKSEINFYNSYPNNYRKLITYQTGYYAVSVIETPDTTYNRQYFIEYNPLKDPCTYAGNGAAIKKWIDLEAYKNNQSGFSVTLYLLRYAQTLLTYAESKARIGELDASAYEAINKIRRRANNVNPNTPSEFDLSNNLTTEQFIDSVVWERAWELCFEPEGRWFDILRLDLMDEIDDNRNEMEILTIFSEKNLTNDWYFYKIPQEDRWLNPNLEEDSTYAESE